MKLKAPKTWQMVLIFVTIVLLIVGGGVLYVYLNDGFKTSEVYPQTIDITDSDNILNLATSQYEATEDFSLTFTSQTEGVNRKGITLSFPSGIAVSRDEENGTISDGVIIVPEKVNLDESFTVSLVKQPYDKNNNLIEDLNNYNAEENGAPNYINKGGVSNLVITPESDTDYSRQIRIAVDVPVLSVEIKFFDLTTGLEFEQESGATIIPEGTNFVAKPVFTPQESAYMFSDDKASNISEENKREKSVFYTLGTGVTGIQLNQSADGIYFTALEQVSQDNLVRAFAFASAKDELEFVAQNSSLEGEAFYNQAIRVLSTSENSIKGDANLSVIEANVGLFSILQNSADHPYELSVDKLFKILAGNNNPNGGALSATIQDIHGADLSGMIRNIGMRVISATDSTGQDLIGKVDLRGGNERLASNENSYVLINSNVRDLNLAYFELSSSVECEIQLGIVLIVQDEEGNYNIFDEEKILYASVSTHEEDDVEWDIDWLDEEVEGINLKIIYNNGVPVPAQYAQNLYDVAVVPASNVYQRKVVFAYGDGVEGNVSYSQQGLGTYSYNGENTKFYPLEGGELVVNHATSFNIVFATVQTNAYNEPIFNEDGTYKLIKTSLLVTVDVEDSLRGINDVEVEVTNGDVWLEGTQAPAYAIPSGSNITGDTIGNTIKMTISVESGDEQLFIDEFNNGNITFFASKDENGAGEKITNVFRFGTPVSNGAGTGSVSLNIGIEPNLKFSVEKGENYYLVVEYNNSISTERKIANIGGADRLDYITVYDQQTKTIKSGLENKNLTVTQTLESDGTSSIDITGLEESSVGLNVLNNYFAEFREENQNGIKTLDQYGREFKGNYSIASSNPTLVMANDISKTISFGNGSGTATVTIKSGSATITLNFSVTSTGVSSIYVLDQQYTGTSSVSYSYTPTGVGDGSTEIKLKNESGNQNSSSVDQGILTVYVNDGDKYSNDAYTITLAPTFLSEVNSDLWNMISYKTINADGTVSDFSNGTPLSSDSIYSLRLNNHFGRSVTLIFNARNDNGTLNFTFSLTIQPTAQLTENSLNQVNYGEGITGVEKHTDTNTIGVYAGFGINLNNTSGTDTTIPNDVKNYLQVNNVEWGAVFEGNYYIYSDGSIKTENENGYIAQINKGVLTFNDVTQPTSYNIKLYAVNTPDVDPLKGNYYGFSIDLSFVVYPNLQIEKSKITKGTISLLAMAQTETSGYSYTNIFELSRITTYKVSSPYNTSIGTNDLTDQLEADGLVGSYKFVDENNNDLEYIKVDMESNGNISRKTTSLHFDRNTSSKEIVLYCYDNSGNVIASNTFDLTLGIDVEKLKNSTTPLLLTADGVNAIEEALNFDGKTMALITQSSIKISRGWVYNGDATTGLTAELVRGVNDDFYSVSDSDNDYYLLNLEANKQDANKQALRYDNNAYIRFNFKSAGGSDYATWDIPVVLSQIGGDFPGEDNADLYDVINNGVNADVLGGGAYSLLDLAGLTATSGDITISFSYLKDGAVSTDYSDSLISSLTNGNIVFKNLSTNYSGLVNGKLPMDIQITMLKGNFSQKFVLHIFVTPNATLDSVNYPYEEATTEYLSVESSLPVNLETPHSNGNKRFPDIATPTVEENLTATLTSSDDNNFTGSILINEKTFVVEYTAETNQLTLSLGETVAKGENGKIIVEGKEYSYALNDSTLTLSLLGLGEATYKIKAFYVDGVEASYNNLVSISGSELTLTNANNGLDNSTLIVEKSYSNFFGETLEYIFTINSTNVEYFLDIKKANDESADNVSQENGDWVINLGRGEGDHKFSITTKQRWENGEESSVLPNEVETILQAPSVVGYSFTLDTTETNPKTLTITVPAFVEADREINLTFVINDGQAEINVKVLIPATVDMQWIDDTSLQGGSEYKAVKKDESNTNGMFENIPADVEITSVIAYVPGNYDVPTTTEGAQQDPNKTDFYYIPANFIDITDTTISVQPIYGESKTATIRVYYSYNGNTGYTEKTFNFEPNISIKSQGIGDILAKRAKTIALTQILESSGTTNITSGGRYTLNTVNIDENLFASGGIEVSGSDTAYPYLEITPEYVGKNTPARIEFTLTYEKGGYSFTTDNIELTFTIVAAATYDVSYPNPFGAVKDLGYESYSKGVIAYTGDGINLNNFFGGKADFAKNNRITFNDVSIAENDGTTSITTTPKLYSDIANDIDYSIISFSGFSNSDGVITNSTDIYDSTAWNTKIFKVAEGVTVAEGASVTFGITYKGVTAQYTIYFFTTVISASTNNTINYVTTASGSYENIYADNSGIYNDDGETNIFAKNRLAELSIVRDGAVAGSLQKIYVRKLGADGKTYEYLDKPLASFVLTQSMIDKGSNIFVDIGILSSEEIANIPISTTDNLLNEGYEFVIGSFNSDGDFVGSTAVSFVRQTSRVEYKYRLSNGNTQLINSADLIICESESDASSGKFEEGEESTFIVTYKITESGTEKGKIEYKLKKVLDIEAQHAWSQSNQTVIEIETNKINHYTLVNEMGIRHPSTGEMLSAENIGEAGISLQVVDTSGWLNTDWDGIGGLPSNIPSSEFKYQTTSGDDYLSFTPIKDNDKVYDYYLFGEGADNNGTYVLLKLIYTASSTTKTFYFVVKLIPDYNVTIGGMQVATAGVVTDGVASNEDNPYNFVPDDQSVFNIATNSNSIISFVRSNWDSSNIAKSLTYTLTVRGSGNGYNDASNIAKLNIGSPWKKAISSSTTFTDIGENDTANAGNIYKWENTSGASNELKLIPTSIAFGQKLYMIKITNSWGFEIEFYFTLSSPSSQNPVISTAFSDATFTEGEKFDVGVIYDKIVATPVIDEEGGNTGDYDLTMQRDNPPEDNSGSVKMIVVDNIATWGVNAEANNVVGGDGEDNNINSGEDIYKNYMTTDEADKMTYKYVTIESVGFKYLDENSRNAEPGNVCYELITSSDLESPWQNITYIGIDDGENPGRFTVPNLPGWYYGTNSSVQVEVHVTLKYQKDGDIETCDISFPATVSRQYNVSTSKNVVIDAQSFNLSDYIKVKNNGDDVTTDATYYDDTLEVTLPAGGQATVTVEITRGSEEFEGSKTINNTYQYRPETTYNSLSEILGMTLQPNTDTVTINVTASEGTSGDEDFRVRYGGNDIKDNCLTTDGQSIIWGSITDDTLYIEDSGRFTNNYATVNKSYIVGVNNLYYRYNQVYWLTREYYSLDTGLGDTTIRQIDADASESGIQYYDETNKVWKNYIQSANGTPTTANFKIPISAWAKDVIIYQATQNNGQIGNGSNSPLAGLFDIEFNITYRYVPAEGETPATCTFIATGNATFVTIEFKDGVGSFDMTYGGETTTYEFKTDSNGNLISINGHTVNVESGEKFSSILLTSSIYFEVTAGEGDVSTAYFDGTYLYTGPGYTINNQQYILVNIYVKASGGPDRTFERNVHGNDYRLGWFRVILV